VPTLMPRIACRLLADRRGVTAMEYSIVAAVVISATLAVTPMLANAITVVVGRMMTVIG